MHQGILYSEQLENNSKRVVLQYLVVIDRFLPLLDLFESFQKLVQVLRRLEVLSLQALQLLLHLVLDEVKLLSLFRKCLFHFVASDRHLREEIGGARDS